MYKFWLAALLCVMTAPGQEAARKIVALDGFHNNESRMKDHYQWDGVRPGGFSELGKVMVAYGKNTHAARL
jgi:hypothetical protein